MKFLHAAIKEKIFTKLGRPTSMDENKFIDSINSPFEIELIESKVDNFDPISLEAYLSRQTKKE